MESRANGRGTAGSAAERGGNERPADATRQERTVWSDFFGARFARLEDLSGEWGKQLAEKDWRVRLLRKALFSTWADLHELGETRQSRN